MGGMGTGRIAIVVAIATLAWTAPASAQTLDNAEKQAIVMKTLSLLSIEA